MNEVKLRVVEALQEDAYKGVARIDSSIMRKIGIRPGDVVSIMGERQTVAIADRAYPADIGEGIIRIDGIIRRNAKTSLSEYVIIKKIEIADAKKVTIAPARKDIMVEMSPEVAKRGLLGRAVITGDILVLGGTRRRRDIMENSFEEIMGIFGEAFGGTTFPGFGSVRFIVASTQPKGPVRITDTTLINVSPKALEVTEEKVPDVTYEDIGGLDEEIKKIREMVELPLKHPEVFSRLGIEPPKGVLLYGPPGTGKTLLAKAVANESEANFILLNGPEIMSKFYGESEKKVRGIFEQASKDAPSIIFIDEIDAIAPKREESYGEVERRVVSQLLTMMDGLKARGKVIVIGATNRPNALDPALRRPGRFDREIEVGVPDKKGRSNILKIHTRSMPLTRDVDIDHIASITYGFVGADLAALCKEAAMSALRRVLPKINLEEKQLSRDVLEKLQVTDKDFKNALRIVRPSAMREVLIETPNIKWKDIGGLERVKQNLKEAVEWPLKYSDSFRRLGIEPPKGVLLYGPPGTGKTLLAKAVASESEANFIHVAGPSLISKWVGESEKAIRQIFSKARQVSPCIIFFDEIDSIASRRGYDTGSKATERMLNQLLSEMDGLQELKDIVVIAATNRPDILDAALLRPGRFDRIVSVNVPNEESRLNILKIHTEKMPLGKDVDLKIIAKKTDGFVGADLAALCKEAGILALRENKNAKQVKKKHFDSALKAVGPSVTKELAKAYKDVEQNYLRSAKAAIGTSYTG